MENPRRCARLSRSVDAEFSGRGSSYVQAVTRELVEAGRSLDATLVRLRAAEDFTNTFVTRLVTATSPGG